MRVKCPGLESNTISLAKTQTWTTRPRVKYTKLEDTMLYTKTQYYFVNKTCGYPVLLTYAEDGNEDQVDYQLPQGGLHMSFRI